MSHFLLPFLGFVVVFIVVILLLPKSQNASAQVRRQGMLGELERSRQEMLGGDGENYVNVIQDHDYTMADALSELGGLGQTLVRLPGGLLIYRRMVQSGLQDKGPIFFAVSLAITCLASFLLWRIAGPLSILAGIALSFLAIRAYLQYRINKRLRMFMDRFADGIDMIVRAVRAGNPVNASMRLVAEHGESPVKDEFRILVDEITYGRPLVDALARLAKRVPEYDVSFFVVVLTIQQETGGNLGEVLGKLSHIIRKRQELFLKIRAITSEGRASAWILGALPPFVTAAVYFTTPEYLLPLFNTTPGNIMLLIACLMIFAGFMTIRKMADIEV